MNTTTSKRAQAEQERAEAIETLRTVYPVGSTVYTILEHVSASGMSRRIKFLHVDGGDICRATYLVGLATGYKRSGNYDGLRVDGCGMDMGYHVVHSLGVLLHGDGYSLRHQWL
jgi:hypothetical protein